MNKGRNRFMRSGLPVEFVFQCYRNAGPCILCLVEAPRFEASSSSEALPSADKMVLIESVSLRCASSFMKLSIAMEMREELWT